MNYEHVTIMFSLPRSGTQWWANLFGGVHDPLAHCGRPELITDHCHVQAGGPGRVFLVDTAAILFHDRIVKALPGAKRIYNFRPVDEVRASLVKQTGFCDEAMLQRAAEKLYRHAFEHDNNKRVYYGCWNDKKLDELWRLVKGTEPPCMWARARAERIDVPMRDQYRNESNIRSLKGYIE